MKAFGFSALIALCLGLMAGCGSSTDNKLMDSDIIELSLVDVSFSNSIQPLFTLYCTECHRTGSNPLVLTEGDAYANIYSITSNYSAPANIVTPGEKSISILYRRVTGDGLTQMPKGRTPLKDDYQNMIGNWIDEGALDN